MGKYCLILLGVWAALLPVATPAPTTADAPPSWAFPVTPANFKPEPDDGKLRHVPGSNLAYTLKQVRDLFAAPDWHPSEHPPMPGIVAQGRRPDVYACGVCHRADGAGGPENSSLAGLPAAYIEQQLAAFKSGARNSSVMQRKPPQFMITAAKAATTAEIKVAAAYFSSLKLRSNIRVVEASSVPKTYITGDHLALAKNAGQEPLGQRIIEVPEDLQQFWSRDTHARFVVYAPLGSIRKGKALVTTGAGKTLPCAGCHGTNLQGLGPFPGIAGRSPSYFVRQLYDFKHGARKGASSAVMMPTVEKLNIDDMIALAAYAASLPP